MSTPHPAQAFLATWKLLPEHCQYEFGFPPRSGTYAISAEGDGLAFRMEWTDALGQPQRLKFNLTFGEGRFARMDLVDARTLDTTNPAAQPGAASYARRSLSEDGRRMTVTQQGTTPDGKPFSNVALYERVG